MSFTHFTDSTPAYANELMDNFYHIGQGDRLPMSGTSLALAGSYSGLDLGSSVASWLNLYANNLYIEGSLTTSDRSMWTLISEVTVSVAASSIDITGLNGDDSTQFMIQAKMLGSVTSIFQINELKIAINYSVGAAAYTATVFKYTHIVTPFTIAAGTVIADREIEWTAFLRAAVPATNTMVGCTYGHMIIHGRSQDDFTPAIGMGGGTVGLYTDRINKNFLVLAVDETITSLNFWANNSDNLISTGSTIKVWGRK